MIKCIIITSLFLVAGLLSFSQNIYNLAGTVIDNAKHKVVTGKISLLDGDDSSEVKTLPLTNGSFLFDTTRAADYILKVTAFGFADKVVSVSLNETKNLVIQLEPSKELMKENEK